MGKRRKLNEGELKVMGRMMGVQSKGKDIEKMTIGNGRQRIMREKTMQQKSKWKSMYSIRREEKRMEGQENKRTINERKVKKNAKKITENERLD